MKHITEIRKFEKTLSMIKQSLDNDETITDLDIEDILCPDDEDQLNRFIVYLNENNIIAIYNEIRDKYIYIELK